MAEKNIVPNLEAKATDGNPIFTPRQWLDRFRQFTKREHKIDNTPLAKGEDITETGWTEKEATTLEDFIGEWDRRHYTRLRGPSMKEIKEK